MAKVTYHKDDMLEEFMSNSTPEELKAYIRVTDELLNERNRVIEAIPACNVHGHQCVPHALEWIEQQRERVPTPVTSRLPLHNQCVLFWYTLDNSWHSGYFKYEREPQSRQGYFSDNSGRAIQKRYATYWLPVPEVPGIQMSNDRDVTDLVKFGNNDDEFLPMARCVCGKTWRAWEFTISVHREQAHQCARCGRRFYFTNELRVWEVSRSRNPGAAEADTSSSQEAL